MGRCGLGGVKGHIKAFEKVKQGGAPCKIDAGGNSATAGRQGSPAGVSCDCFGSRVYIVYV